MGRIRKHMKNIYMMILLAAVLLVVSGCGGQQETAEMNIIGFGDLQTDGLVTWGAGTDVCEKENASDKEDVSEEESTSDKEDVSSEGSVSGTDVEDAAEVEDSEAEEKEGVLLCIDREVLDNPLYDSFINNDVTATDNIPVKDGIIHDRLGFEWSGSEYYLKDLYQRFQDKTMSTGGINGIQVFGRDLDGDGKDELIVLIEYYVYSKLCGIMYPFHEENGVLYAWEEMRTFDGKGMSTFYEDGTILTAEEGASTYVHYTKKGEIEPLLYYYETPYTGAAGNWDDIECTNKLYVYENGEKSIEIVYEYEYWVHADLERIEPEMSALRGQCNRILKEFTAKLGEGDSVAAMSNYHRADEFAARATLEDIMSIPVDYFRAERSVYTVSYSIDEDVKENENELFMQFINGEVSAYEKVEEAIVPNEGTDGESSDAEENADVQIVSYEIEVPVTDVYNEYRTSYPVYYVDAFWYAIDEVRYTMQDLDADGRAELLMLVSYGDHVEDLHVFHVENDKLYRWETMEDIRRSGNATELYFYENGMIGFVGKEDATYMQYNEDGDIELTLVIDTGRRPNGEFEFNRIYFIAYKVIVYENGVQKKVLYYEDKFATSDDEFMSTSDVFIKDEYKKIVDAFLEELGEGETIKRSNIGFYTETLFIPELVGCYRLEYLNQEELLELFEQGEIPAQRLKIENGVKQIYGDPFYITDMYPGYPHPETARADLDGDQNAELIVKGYYGGTYFDAGYGMVYSIADGEGTAQVLSYAYYNDEVWLVKSDTTHGGRVCYWFYRVDHTGAVVEEFTLHKFFWETPSEPDGPDTVYEYNDEEITKEEYDSILKSIEFHYTSSWY